MEVISLKSVHRPPMVKWQVGAMRIGVSYADSPMASLYIWMRLE